MIITLEKHEVELLVRKAIDRNDIPVPEGYIIVSIEASYDDDTDNIELDICLEPEGQNSELIKIND